MTQSVLSLTRIQTSATVEGEGKGSAFPLQDTSHVPARTAPSLICPGPWQLRQVDAGLNLQRCPAERIVQRLHAGSRGRPRLQLGTNIELICFLANSVLFHLHFQCQQQPQLPSLCPAGAPRPSLGSELSAPGPLLSVTYRVSPA